MRPILLSLVFQAVVCLSPCLTGCNRPARCASAPLAPVSVQTVAPVIETPPDEKMWRQVSQTKEPRDCILFLREYPNSLRAEEVRSILDHAARLALEERSPWFVSVGSASWSSSDTYRLLADISPFLEDQATLRLLGERALAEGDGRLLRGIVGRLEDQKLLTEIAKRGNRGDGSNRTRALARITDQTCLAEIVLANLEYEPNVSLAALCKLTKPEALLALEKQFPEVSDQRTDLIRQLLSFRARFFEDIKSLHSDATLSMSAKITGKGYGVGRSLEGAEIMIAVHHRRGSLVKAYQTSFPPVAAFPARGYAVRWIHPTPRFDVTSLLAEVKESLGVSAITSGEKRGQATSPTH